MIHPFNPNNLSTRSTVCKFKNQYFKTKKCASDKMVRQKAKKTRESEAQTNGVPCTTEQGGIFPGEAWLMKKIKEEALQIFSEEIIKYKQEADKTIQDLKEKVSVAGKRETELIEQTNHLKEEIETLKSKLYNQAEKEKSESTKAMLKIDDIEQESKLNNLRLVGIHEEEAEILQQKVVEIIRDKLNLQAINGSDINTCYRLGKPNESKTRDVIVRFNSRDKRNLIYQCKRNMPRENQPIYINEDLTLRRNKLFYDARSMKKSGRLTAVWTQEGNIIIKTSESSDPLPVKTHRDLRNALNPEDENTNVSDYDSYTIDQLDYDSDIIDE